MNKTRCEGWVNKSTSYICGSVSSIALLASIVPSSANAVQEVDSTDNIFFIEEVIITAQKRATSAQEVPIAVSVFSNDHLTKKGIEGLDGLSSRAPGFFAGDFSDVKLAPITLRGVFASTFTAGQDPSVGVYLDEVFLGAGASASIDFLDIARIEVLRGPQGTFFGRNSVGGAVNITTNGPSWDFEGNIQAEYGNYDSLKVKGMVNIPIVDEKLAIRIAGSISNRDGFVFDEALGEDANDAKAQNLRAKLLFAPSEQYDATLTFDYRDIGNQGSGALEVIEINNSFPPVIDPSTGQPVLGQDGNTIPNVFGNLVLAAQLGLIPGVAAPVLNTDPFDRVVRTNAGRDETLEGWGGSWHQRMELFSPDTEIVSVTSYREHDYTNRVDSDMTTLDFAEDGSPENVKRFSQEVRLSGGADTNFLWTVGGYYYFQDTLNGNFVTFGSDLAPLLAQNPAVRSIAITQEARTKLNSYAAFAHANITLTDTFRVEVGARYTNETKNIVYNQLDPTFAVGGNIQFEGRDSWDAFTPSASLVAQWTDDILTYVTVSNGFKSGGFNDGLGESSSNSFDPEKLWNYEVGLKADWYDGRVRTNLAAFYIDWSNIQVRADDPVTPTLDITTANGGAATSKGVELEATIVPWADFQLNASFAYADLDYSNDEVIGLAIPLVSQVFSPKYSFNISAQYELEIDTLGTFLMSGEYLRRGENFLQLDGVLNSRVPAHGILNAYIAWEVNEDTTVTLWANNITDEIVRTRFQGFLDNPFVGQDLADLNPPRTYGVRVSFDF